MKAIKFGVWGFGRMGSNHGKFYAMEQDKFELAAVCDTNEQRLAAAKDEYGCAVYSDSNDFLNNPEIELAVIVTLSLDHTRHALKALESGKYVLLDKPIAITDGELEALRQADKKYPGKLFILHNLRFEPGFEAVQKELARGLLGEINMIKIRRHHKSWYSRSDWQTLLECGGGLLNNWGNHDIDHAVQLLGCHPDEICSRLWHESAGGTGDDHLKIILKGGNRRLADIEISYNVALPEPYCTVYGSKGALVLNSDMNEIQLRYIDPAFKMPDLQVETNTLVYKQNFNIPWIEEKIKVDFHGNMWEYIDRKLIKFLYDDIKNGVPFPIKNNDAFETVRIMQEIKKQNPEFAWIE